VGENLICINEGEVVVYLYDLNDFKLIKNLAEEAKARESSPRV
jgi:hypothetical protein